MKPQFQKSTLKVSEWAFCQNIGDLIRIHERKAAILERIKHYEGRLNFDHVCDEARQDVCKRNEHCLNQISLLIFGYWMC